MLAEAGTAIVRVGDKRSATAGNINHLSLCKCLFIDCSENAYNRKRPEYYNHIWSYDLLSKRLENGKLLKLPVVLDEFTRECLAIDVGKKL